MRRGATLIDIRTESQRAQDGLIPGALPIARNELEWRLDPTSGHRHPDAPGLDDEIVLICNQGYQSSLAAASLQQLGFTGVTGLDGGFQAWRAAGLPVKNPPRPRNQTADANRPARSLASVVAGLHSPHVARSRRSRTS